MQKLLLKTLKMFAPILRDFHYSIQRFLMSSSGLEHLWHQHSMGLRPEGDLCRLLSLRGAWSAKAMRGDDRLLLSLVFNEVCFKLK